MSSPKKRGTKPISRTQPFAPKKSAVPAAFGDVTSAAEKAAFTKALFHGITPGTEAARRVARKKAGGEGEPAVEILRRIPAPPRNLPDSDESSYALQLAADIDNALKAGAFDRFSPRAQQELIGALCRLYAVSNEESERFGALVPGAAISATEVMILCGALLKAVDVQAFELSMWLNWSSR